MSGLLTVRGFEIPADISEWELSGAHGCKREDISLSDLHDIGVSRFPGSGNIFYDLFSLDQTLNGSEHAGVVRAVGGYILLKLTPYPQDNELLMMEALYGRRALVPEWREEDGYEDDLYTNLLSIHKKSDLESIRLTIEGIKKARAEQSTQQVDQGE